jgi:hypothetical protein
VSFKYLRNICYFSLTFLITLIKKYIFLTYLKNIYQFYFFKKIYVTFIRGFKIIYKLIYKKILSLNSIPFWIFGWWMMFCLATILDWLRSCFPIFFFLIIFIRMASQVILIGPTFHCIRCPLTDNKTNIKDK